MVTREEKWFFVASVAVRVALLLLLIHVFGNAWEFRTPNASEQFLTIGQNVFDGKGFLNSDTGVLESAKAPGYALFLGFFSAVHLPLWSASIVQILIFSLLPIFVMRFVGQLGGGIRARRVAGVFTAFEPLQILYSVSLMPDALTAVLFFFGMYFLFSFSRNERVRNLIFSSFFFALSNYFRPSGIPWMFLIPIGLFVWWGCTRREWISGIRYACIFGIMFFLLVSPWMIRNERHFRNFSFSSGSAPYFFSFSAPAVRAVRESRDFWDVQGKMRSEILTFLPEPHDLNSIRNADILGARAYEIISAHPKIFLKLYAFALPTYFTAENYHYLLKYYGLIGEPKSGQVSLTDLFAKEGIRAVLNRLSIFIREPYGMIALGGRILGTVLFLASLWGAYILWHRRSESRFVSILYLFFIAYGALTATTAVAGIEARHRLYLNALIFIFAAIGFFGMQEKEKSQS